jgi:serine palmitoyltransferase
MPSPIALNLAPSRSMFQKRSSSSLVALASAKSYLSAVSEADARARAHGAIPTATPALSLSSSVTTNSEDSVLAEDDDNSDGLALPAVPPTSEQVFTTSHLEFGHSVNEDHRYTSQHVAGTSLSPYEPEPPYYILITTYMSYILLIVLGHIRDFLGKRFHPGSYRHLMPANVRPIPFERTDISI